MIDLQGEGFPPEGSQPEDDRVVMPPFAEIRVQALLSAALARLDQARRYAQDVHVDPWQFAVSVTDLLQMGLTESDLRWLTAKGYATMAEELETVGRERRFRSTERFALTPATGIVVTSQGKRLFDLLRTSGSAGATGVSEQRVVAPRTPRWDRSRGELHLGETLVKRFRLPAPNQKRILSAFEEERWPPRIDDPLPPHPEIDSKRRLHHTLVALNRNQKQKLIQFQGDGTGQGICWALAS